MSVPITSFRDSAMYINNLKFPAKLHKMLCDPSLSDIMIWTPCGQAWKILDSGDLFEEVTAQSKYFSSSTPFGIRYRSFMRQVSYWGFTKIKSGRNKDCYFNKFFKRDSPHLLSEMKRRPRDNTQKHEAGKQVVSQNNASNPDGVTTLAIDNGHTFSSSANLKKNPCIMRKSIPKMLENHGAQEESNEDTCRDENKASSYQKWCKQRYSTLMNQEHVDEKMDVVEPLGPDKEREEKETQQREEQKQTTEFPATPDFISSSNSGSSSDSDSKSDTPKIFQLFKELQKQKNEEQEAQKAPSSTTRSSSVSHSSISDEYTNEVQQELLRKNEAQSTVSSSGYGYFSPVNSMTLNSSLLLPQQDHQLELHMQALNEISLRNELLREELSMGFLQRVQQMQLQKRMEYHEAMVQLSHLEQMARSNLSNRGREY
eukprot:CAMPEP_0178943908 /NCGR_PEP_ID=MMETSP0789-20121207/2849_1 /TAXON_ID=3005 /ORGANISM="Rhizosolenia setigera, Strain CCMP 1694" /LENGTH=427 /DNA_ID=CAMNT_0020623557 /DNA_START=64 /DNA_END=1347 /DNA_ORIENTATION=+